MKKATTVAEYLAALPPKPRAVLKEVRAVVRKALPDAEEVISYGIPGYRMHGRVAVFFAGFPQHWSLYPVTADVRAQMGDALDGLPFSTGTLRFDYADAVKVRLVTKLVKTMVARAALKQAMTKAKKQAR